MMNPFPFLQSFWKELFAQKQQQEELQEELQFHLEMQIREYRKQGMSEQEARRRAVLKLGGVTRVQEDVKVQSPVFWLESLYKDAQYGFRSLKKSPGFAIVALLSLALSIGASTALFSLVNGILLRPLPYPEPDRLVMVQDINQAMGIETSGVSARNVMDWRVDVLAFDGIAAYYTMGRTLSGSDGSEVVLSTQVGTDFFSILGTPPLLGRTFTTEETARSIYNGANGIMASDPVVVLSHALWKRRFGSDPEIIGKSLLLDRRSWKIIGVMPQHFAMPDNGTALWIPWSVAPDRARDQHFAECVARLKKGVMIQQAETELNIYAEKLESLYPGSNTGWRCRIVPLKQAMTGDVGEVLWVLITAVLIVLIIACANIAVLHLSRTTARVQESYVRLALGAGRSRLIRQFLVESAMLSITGAILGLLLAYFSLELLRAIVPGLPRLEEVSIHPVVFLWSVLLTVFCTLLFGLGPALVAVGSARTSLTAADGFRTTVHRTGQRFRNALVVLEISMAVILLSSSFLLIQSYSKLQAVDPGFNPLNVLVAPVFLDMEKYGSGEKTRSYYKILFEKLEQLPEVESVGGATALPASPLGPDFERPVWDSTSPPVDSSKRFADVRMITPQYFQTMGMTMLRGRGFSHTDGPDASRVVIVNEALARKIWSAENPIGKQLIVDYSTAGTYAYHVIGVVKNVRFHGLRSEPRPEIYFAHAQRSYLILNIAIRTTKDPRLLIASVRDVFRDIDPLKPAHNITPLADLVHATVLRDRYVMTVVSTFAFVAFALAILGIYGVLAYSVRQRVREIGIRMALGAKQDQIIRWITQQGLRLLLMGLVTGLVAALLFARLLSGLLFEVSTLDWISYAAAILALLITALAASWIPARRASRMNPTIALRYE
jgi:putative ABC transport system permease protein